MQSPSIAEKTVNSVDMKFLSIIVNPKEKEKVK